MKGVWTKKEETQSMAHNVVHNDYMTDKLICKNLLVSF